MMQVSIFILAIVVYTSAAPEVDVKAGVDKCSKSQGISDFESIMNPKSMTLKDENNENGRCFIECLMKEFGILKGNNLDADVVMVEAKDMIQYAKNQGIKVDESEVRTAVKNCGSKDGSGKCMKSYQMWKCLNDYAHETLGL